MATEFQIGQERKVTLKTIKGIFYSLVILILIGCVAILVCALNPSLTRSLADKLNGSGAVADMEPPKEPIVNINTGADTGINWDVVTVFGDGIYITPSRDELQLPGQSIDRSGYEQINDETTQINDEEGDRLKETLQTGPLGQGLSFDKEFYPYYAMLTDTMQQLYRQIYANAMEVNSDFVPVVAVNTNQLKNVFEAVYNDHPELFWLDSGYSCKYMRNGLCVSVTLLYNQTASCLQDSKNLFEAKVNEILAGAMSLSDASIKEKYVYDTLAQKVDYHAAATMNQSAYSALVNGQSVCAGYARAFQYLLQQLRIPCYYCTGFSGEDHAWNIVKLGSEYFNADITWDDADPVSYDYYNKTDEELSSTHIRTGLSVYLPACGQKKVQSSVDELINPNPQKPLEYEEEEEEIDPEWEAAKKKQENLDKAGITEDQVRDTMEEYYADCLKQMVEEGAGMQQFSNVIPETLWKDVEQVYINEKYKEGYVNEALKQLGKENFAIQLQGQRLGGGYYRLYHNISTW